MSSKHRYQCTGFLTCMWKTSMIVLSQPSNECKQWIPRAEFTKQWRRTPGTDTFISSWGRGKNSDTISSCRKVIYCVTPDPCAARSSHRLISTHSHSGSPLRRSTAGCSSIWMLHISWVFMATTFSKGRLMLTAGHGLCWDSEHKHVSVWSPLENSFYEH